MSAFRKTGMSIMDRTNYTNIRGGGGGGFNQMKKPPKTLIRKPTLNSTASDFSHDTFKEQFQGRSRKDFINEANKIMRERMKNKGSTINSKSKFKSEVLMDNKEISLKNYLIGLLKEKRTDINEKERNIEKALKQSENQLDRDTKEFIDFVEATKRRLKLEDDEYVKYRNLHEQAESIYRKESSEYKKLLEDLERTVKSINVLRGYGTFVYKVLGTEFWFSDIKEVDPRLRNYEEVANNILNKYNNIINNGNQDIINDEALLIIKFKEFEDKVIKDLESKESVDKEITYIKKNYNNEIEELKKREKDFRNEVKRVNREKKDLFLNNQKAMPQQSEELDVYMKYIFQLGQAIGCVDKKFNKGKKNNINDYITLAQDTLKVLADIEKEINGYINEIEKIEIFGDKKLIYAIEQERKKDNKREKQLELKLNQEELEKKKRQKAVGRAKRLVIKGRKVPKEYPIIKEKKKKNEDNKNKKDNDFDMLYYSDDEN
jgi:DNA repair exonuclease SbcCD ATPase subunit